MQKVGVTHNANNHNNMQLHHQHTNVAIILHPQQSL